MIHSIRFFVGWGYVLSEFASLVLRSFRLFLILCMSFISSSLVFILGAVSLDARGLVSIDWCGGVMGRWLRVWQSASPLTLQSSMNTHIPPVRRLPVVDISLVVVLSLIDGEFTSLTLLSCAACELAI